MYQRSKMTDDTHHLYIIILHARELSQPKRTDKHSLPKPAARQTAQVCQPHPSFMPTIPPDPYHAGTDKYKKG